MAKKKTVRQMSGVTQRLDTIERLVRIGFRRVDRSLEIVDAGQSDLRAEISQKFAVVDERINLLTNHVDGFIKLHETLDIEFKVIKEQMSRMEERVKVLEAARST
ncbi:MAG: hypothetical protein ACREP5_16605, partial [Candidatus Binatia bacterium]